MSENKICVDLDKCLSIGTEIARAAGAEILAGFTDGRAQSTAGWKGTADLVTDVDRRVEKLVFDRLREAFPGYGFIGEETAGSTETVGDLPTWVVDPIDGTTNFVHGYPQVCIALALFVDKKPAVAIILNPVLDELFTAIRGRGAYLNGTRRLHVSKSQSLKEAVVSTNVGCMRDPRGIAFLTGNISRILDKQVLSMRMTGSASMSLASVACGRLCAFYEWGIHIWDYAPGVLLVEEAGGKACSPDGSPIDYAGKRVLAGAPAVVDELASILLVKDF